MAVFHSLSFFQSLQRSFCGHLASSHGLPPDPEKRGSHVSLRHPEAYRICKALIDPEMGNAVIIPDFREPDNIRLGITPLFTTFTEICVAVREMAEIVDNKLFLKYSGQRENVT